MNKWMNEWTGLSKMLVNSFSGGILGSFYLMECLGLFYTVNFNFVFAKNIGTVYASAVKSYFILDMYGFHQ